MDEARKALLERQKKWLKEHCGIETYEQLVEAMKKQPPLDIGIFVLPQVEQVKAS
ncbi:MAG: hypothetical protein IJ516_05770 [Phascolarctobacterium sp.]|nr:hypothetical protein [Phascolarctobacterium sp.]